MRVSKVLLSASSLILLCEVWTAQTSEGTLEHTGHNAVDHINPIKLEQKPEKTSATNKEHEPAVHDSGVQRTGHATNRIDSSKLTPDLSQKTGAEHGNFRLLLQHAVLHKTSKLAPDSFATKASYAMPQLAQNRAGDRILFPSWTDGLSKVISNVSPTSPVQVNIVRPIAHPITHRTVYPIIRPIVRPIAVHIAAPAPTPKSQIGRVVVIVSPPSPTPSVAPSSPSPTSMWQAAPYPTTGTAVPWKPQYPPFCDDYRTCCPLGYACRFDRIVY